MQALTSSLQNIVLPHNISSRNKLTLTCFLFAAICKVILVTLFFSFSHDLILQGLAAQSMADGYGFTIPQVHAGNLSKVVYDPLVGWPPAFSAVIVPFYLIVGKHLALATLVTICVISVLFIPLAGKLLEQLQFPAWVVNLFVVIYGLSIPKYLELFSATDLPALMCYMLALYQLLVFTGTDRKKSSYGIYIGISCALGVWFRYMYLPVSFVLPVFLLWNGYLKKNKRLKQAGFYAFIVNGILVAALLTFEHYYTGSATYYRPVEKGLFLSNLHAVTPFVPASFMNIHFYTMKLAAWRHIAYMQSLQLITNIGFLPAFFMVILFCWYAIKKKLNTNGPSQTFFIAGGLLSFAVILLMLYLTVSFSSYYGFPSNFEWVYGAEERYFIIPIFCIQVFILWWLFVRKPVRYKIVTNICRGLFVIIIAIEMIHGAFVISKYLKGTSVRWHSVAEQNEVNAFLQNTATLARQQQKELVVGTLEAGTHGQPTLLGINELFRMDELISDPVYCERPTLLVLIVRDAHLPYFKKFLDKHKPVRETFIANEYYAFYCELATGNSQYKQ
ncbi:MAG: hypothetical protein QM731_20325 [Chitinophagaceae bacterium]